MASILSVFVELLLVLPLPWRSTLALVVVCVSWIDPTSSWVLFRLLFMYRVCFCSICKPVRPLVPRIYPCPSLSIPRCLSSSFQIWCQSLACCFRWEDPECCCGVVVAFIPFCLSLLRLRPWWHLHPINARSWCDAVLASGVAVCSWWRILGSPSRAVFGRAYHKE